QEMTNSVEEEKGADTMYVGTDEKRYPPVDDEGLINPDLHLSDEEKAAREKRLMWILDLRLIPWLSLLYLLSFLDRTNVGNAHVEGLQTDLKMNDGEYNASLSIFFVAYALLEPLTNVCLKRFRPHVFISATMVLWSICMVTMGLCHDFSGFMAARFFLGACEAGLFPGVNYLLSCWYKRSEIGIRMAIFFSAAALAGSFGGLLATAISKMEGLGGKPGWAWIFIIEGLATFVAGVISYWAVPGFPDDAAFLAMEDRLRVVYRLTKDAQSSAKHEEFDMKHFWDSMKDWKTWTSTIIYMGCDGPLYAFSLFLPTIINEIVSDSNLSEGYTNTEAQLMSVPPYAVAAVATIAVGFIADRTKQRGICNMVFALIGIAGFIMLLASQKPHVKYAGTFLGALGIYPCISNTIAWSSNNVEGKTSYPTARIVKHVLTRRNEGTYKRGVTMGTVIGLGNLQGVVSSNVYRGQDKPQYYPGHGVVLAYLTVFLLGGTIVQYILLRRENTKRRRGDRDCRALGLTHEEVMALGDENPEFIYTL
ncbi:hypothetical protein KEM55_004900, partial [Ascosphaera atra]